MVTEHQHQKKTELTSYFCISSSVFMVHLAITIKLTGLKDGFGNDKKAS